MKYAISFDVTDDRIRYRVVKTLLVYAYRVQKSVFEGFLSLEQKQECQEKLGKVIDPETDSVRFYPLCKNCDDKVEIIGTGKRVEDTEFMII